MQMTKNETFVNENRDEEFNIVDWSIEQTDRREFFLQNKRKPHKHTRTHVIVPWLLCHR